MKKCISLVVFCVLVIVVHAQTLRVASYNLRYDNKGDTGNLWVNRAPIIGALVAFHDFDIFGTQEGLQNQLEDLQKQLPEYAWYGRGRDDGETKGEHSAIFYKKDKFDLVDKGDFWLSQTPEKPGPGWDAKLNRICSWIKLKDKQTKKTFYFFNVHFDHQGVQARVESSKLILQKIKTIAGSNTVIFTGDFNGGHNSEWYKNIAQSGFLNDALKLAKNPYVNNGSFNSFGHNVSSKEIIDHIFLSNGLAVNKYGILTDTYHGKYPSDHYPVMVVLDWKK